MRVRRSAILLLAAVGVLAATSAAALPKEISIQGFVALRAIGVDAQPSWLAGGFGRLGVGAEANGDSTTLGLGRLHLAVDWEPSPFFGAYAHGLLRDEPDVVTGKSTGLVEAYLHGSLPIGEASLQRLRLGHFLLPTSQENVDVAWSSPYTLTPSAINAWIGEEVRLTGLLAETSLAVGEIDELRLGLSPFGGNDTSGTLLAWRGWGQGDRLTAYDEILPLPPLAFLGPGGGFEDQIDAGTRPFGDDLDGRLGWAAYLRWQRPQTARLQWTRYDNRGDRRLYGADPSHGGGEYAWETDFDLIGFQAHPSPRWSLLGEWMRGATGMGFSPGPHVQIDFEATYLMLSFRPGKAHLSARWEDFETTDRDTLQDYDNDEDGETWTLAVFWEPWRALRLGIELLDTDVERRAPPVPPGAGFPPGYDFTPEARAVAFELRYYLDF